MMYIWINIQIHIQTERRSKNTNKGNSNKNSSQCLSALTHKAIQKQTGPSTPKANSHSLGLSKLKYSFEIFNTYMSNIPTWNVYLTSGANLHKYKEENMTITIHAKTQKPKTSPKIQTQSNVQSPKCLFTSKQTPLGFYTLKTSHFLLVWGVYCCFGSKLACVVLRVLTAVQDNIHSNLLKLRRFLTNPPPGSSSGTNW